MSLPPLQLFLYAMAKMMFKAKIQLFIVYALYQRICRFAIPDFAPSKEGYKRPYGEFYHS